MRLTLATVGAALLAALSVEAAGSEPARDALVRPGRGIGKVALGMTEVQVRRALGPPRTTARRRDLGFGQQYLERQWGYGEWSVGFQGRPGRMRVVMVGTTQHSQRTPSNLGIGSRIRDVVRVYPHATCSAWAGLGTNSSKETWIVVRHPSGTQTVFAAARPFSGPSPEPLPVAAIMVREPASGLAERRSRCSSNWRRQ